MGIQLQNFVSLTTTGTSGAATLSNGVLNVPNYSGDWIDYSATSTIVGWSSFTEKIIYYRQIGKQVFINYSLTGVSNSTLITFTLPINLKVGVGGINSFCFGVDNGVNSGVGFVSNSGVDKVQPYKTATLGAWTASGTKQTRGSLFYIID